jgi:hypothetical protein
MFARKLDDRRSIIFDRASTVQRHMLDTRRPCPPHGRRIACYLISLVGLAFAAGCDDAKDDTQVQPRAGSGGGGAGGSTGGTAGTTAGGEGGAAGSMEPRDAGADASPPASDCVVGTLEQYCSVQECPAFDDARISLRRLRGFPLTARVIVQRPCEAPSGAARIAVSADYRSMALTYIYDAATEALVGVELIDDLGLCSGSDVEFGDPAFGNVSGYYGEASPDCGSGFPRFDVPAACGSFDAGAPDDAGPDAGPSECILTDP